MKNSNSLKTSLKHAFFWLSGAGTETLDRCPDWEQRKYVAFGATVLVPCVFAFIACSYALSTLTSNYRVIFSVAAVWAFIILSIDRALIASYRPYLSIIRKLSQFALRFCVALLMGVTIAHPLVLLLFRDTVVSVIEKDRQEEAAKIRSQFAIERSAVDRKIASIEKAIAEQRDRWNATFQAKFIVEGESEKAPIPGLTAAQQAELKKAINEATAPAKERLAALEKQSGDLTPGYQKLQEELAYWQSEFERELNGQRSGIVGLGPRARSIQDDQLAWRRAEATRTGGLLEHITAEKAKLQVQAREAEAGAIKSFQEKLTEQETKAKNEQQRVALLRQKVQEDQASQFVNQQNELRATLKDQIDARIAELKLAQGNLAKLSEDERAQLAALAAQPRRDILTQTLALHRLFKNGDQGGRFAIWTYLVLAALFMLVDTIPLMVKFFSKPGPYDTLLDRDESRFDAEHRAFLDSHARYMCELASGNLMAVTRNKALEEALVSGVEHTRAAREFLDSLISLEKSFHERMLMEQRAPENCGADKSALLESMKKRFYDDLQQQMETFFENRSRGLA